MAKIAVTIVKYPVAKLTLPLKVSEEEYEKMDQQYLIKIRKEAYGYRCLTNQKQFYMENYPDVVIENGKIDDLVVMMEEQV